MGPPNFIGVFIVMRQVERQRRILFLFGHLHKGGMQRAVSNISLALPDSFKQHIGFFGTENPGFEYKASMHDFGFSGSGKCGFRRKLINGWYRLKAIRYFVLQNKIDVVVSFGESANIYSLMSRHSAQTVISYRVAKDNSVTDFDIYASFYRVLVKALYPYGDIFVAVSEDLGKHMEKTFLHQKKVNVIPNLYHINEIRKRSLESLPPEMAFLQRKKFILNVGSLCYQKGQDDLLTIFAHVCKHYAELFLVIVGRGEWKELLCSRVDSLGITGKVVFVDFDSNPYRYMARALAFVLTSRYEGFPNVLVEAMICGTPSVAFDCPTGPREILGDSRYGYLIRDRSILQASQAISTLIRDDSLRKKLRSLGMQRAQRYSSENVIRKWVRILS